MWILGGGDGKVGGGDDRGTLGVGARRSMATLTGVSEGERVDAPEPSSNHNTYVLRPSAEYELWAALHMQDKQKRSDAQHKHVNRSDRKETAKTLSQTKFWQIPAKN